MSISLDPEKTLKLVRYDYLNRTVVPGQILFAGSSLMEQFPVHEFQLGAGLSSLIYNRGIGGFTTAEMLEHMETCVYALRPARIFLNIGTNDMSVLKKQAPRVRALKSIKGDNYSITGEMS